MRRRLVLSTIAVVLVVILVLFIPVLLIVRDAQGGNLPGDVVGRLAVIATAAIASAALLASVQARQLARPLERLARSASRLGGGDFSAAAPSPSGISEIDDISRALRLSANRVARAAGSSSRSKSAGCIATSRWVAPRNAAVSRAAAASS